MICWELDWHILWFIPFFSTADYVSLQLTGVGLAITGNLFLIIQKLTVINCWTSHICCCLHRQKFTFNCYICNLPVLWDYNHNTTSWVPSSCTYWQRMMATCWQSVFIYRFRQQWCANFWQWLQSVGVRLRLFAESLPPFRWPLSSLWDQIACEWATPSGAGQPFSQHKLQSVVECEKVQYNQCFL